MRAIFISYRREDSEGQAGRLFNDLARHFGEDSVFMDVAGIEAGRDFRLVIDENVATCGVLLAMIGKSWIDAKDESGRRRLEDPMDFVRLETASALKRDIPVVPVLVHGARMPRTEQLPEDLAPLAYRNGVELTHARWDSDVQVLIKALSRYVESQHPDADRANTGSPARVPGKAENAGTVRPPGTVDNKPAGSAQTPKTSLGMIIAGSVVAIAVAVGGGYVWYQKSSQNAEMIRQAELLEEAKKQAAAALEAQRQAEAKAAAAELEKKQAQEKADADKREAERQAKLEADRKAKLDEEARQRPLAEAKAKPAAEKPKSDKAAVVPGPVNLRVQSNYPSKDLRHTVLLEVMSPIGTASAGIVKMDVLPAGAVAPAFAAVEAVAKGTLNAAWISPIFNYRKDTAFGLVEGAPFGLDPGNYAAWRSTKEVNAIVERLYRRYGVVGVACGVTAPHGDIWVKKPISKPDDLKGLKISVIGLSSSMFTKAGAAVNALPTGEIVPAMDRGLIDAAIVSDPRSDLTYDLPAVSRMYMVGQLQGARGLDLVINAGLWDGLQLDTRNAIATACRSNLSKMIAESTRIASEAINEMKKTVKLYRLPNSVSAEFRHAWNEVRSEEMANNRTFSELAATMTAYDSAVQRPNLSVYGLNKP